MFSVVPLENVQPPAALPVEEVTGTNVVGASAALATWPFLYLNLLNVCNLSSGFLYTPFGLFLYFALWAFNEISFRQFHILDYFDHLICL